MPSLAEILALGHIEKYADEQTKKAFIDLTLHHDGKGCQCVHCIKRSVNNWNSWVDYLLEGDDSVVLYQASVVPKKRGLGIMMGSQFDELGGRRE